MSMCCVFDPSVCTSVPLKVCVCMSDVILEIEESYAFCDRVLFLCYILCLVRVCM